MVMAGESFQTNSELGRIGLFMRHTLGKKVGGEC